MQAALCRGRWGGTRCGGGVMGGAGRPGHAICCTATALINGVAYTDEWLCLPSQPCGYQPAARHSPPSSTIGAPCAAPLQREEWARRVATCRWLQRAGQPLAVRSWPCSTLNLATYAALPECAACSFSMIWRAGTRRPVGEDMARSGRIATRWRA